VVAVAAFGVLVVGAHAASAGTLEICKSGANGMSGKTFNFQITPNAGPVVNTSITTVGGGFTCKSPALPGATSAAIVESDPTGQTTETASITVIPSSREVPAGNKNTTTRSVTVNLGTTTANETQVRFVNQLPNGASSTVKVCKLTQTPAYLGKSFSFSIGPTLANQGSLVSTTANDAFDDPANWSCRVLGTFAPNTILYVKEAVPAGTEVDFIDTDPGANLLDFDTDQGWAKINTMTGTTLVLFDDEPIPPSGTGFLEVCKNALPGTQDAAVTGFWDYTITDQDGTVVGTAHVLTNQCQNAIPVPAGILTVTETSRPGFQLVDVTTIPQDALVNSNLNNGTADVEVATSSNPNDETLVNFVNRAITSQLKVCKALGPNSSVLVGQTFNFRVTNITDPNNPVPLGTVAVQAGSTTQCVPFGTVPTGTVVRVDEFFGPDNPNTPFDESGQFITSSGSATTTIQPGTANTVTITNTAFGVLEICKNTVAGLAVQPTFNFRIDGGAIIPVKGNSCSNGTNVSVGNHTVTELNPGDFDVTSIGVNPSNRLVGSPDLANRTVTVNVPYGPSGETVVTYTNTIKTGTVKVCKTIPITSADTLAPGPNGRDYTFNVNIQTSPGNPGTFAQVPLTVHLDPGQLSNCSSFTGPIPVLQTDGRNTIVGVQETTVGNFVVDDITLQFTRGYCSGTAGAPPGAPYPGNNCIPGGKNTTTQNVNFFLAPGPQSATFLQHAT